MKRTCYTMALALGVVTLPALAAAQSNIDPAQPFAWGEAIGWVNLLADTTNGVVVGSSFLSGFAWSESVGWINFGGTPTNLVTFSQTAGDTGVNIDGSGNLTGFAWGEAIGWINFDTTSVGGSQVTVNLITGEFSGFAWSESVGWINFGSGYGAAFVPEGSAVNDWMILAD